MSRKQFADYVITAADLAEALKKDIQKGGVVTSKTVLALNNFIIAANAVSDLTTEMKQPNIKLN